MRCHHLSLSCLIRCRILSVCRRLFSWIIFITTLYVDWLRIMSTAAAAVISLSVNATARRTVQTGALLTPMSRSIVCIIKVSSNSNVRFTLKTHSKRPTHYIAGGWTMKRPAGSYHFERNLYGSSPMILLSWLRCWGSPFVLLKSCRKRLHIVTERLTGRRLKFRKLRNFQMLPCKLVAGHSVEVLEIFVYTWEAKFAVLE